MFHSIILNGVHLVCENVFLVDAVCEIQLHWSFHPLKTASHIIPGNFDCNFLITINNAIKRIIVILSELSAMDLVALN